MALIFVEVLAIIYRVKSVHITKYVAITCAFARTRRARVRVDDKLIISFLVFLIMSSARLSEGGAKVWEGGMMWWFYSAVLHGGGGVSIVPQFCRNSYTCVITLQE